MSTLTSFAFNLWWVVFRPWVAIGDPSTLFSFSQVRLVGSPDVSDRWAGIPLGVWALIVFCLVVFPFVFLLLRKGRQMVQPKNLVLFLAIVALLSYMTFPKMHDRYMYPALVLFSASVGFRPRLLPDFVALTVLNFLNLSIVWHPTSLLFLLYSGMNNQWVQWGISLCTVGMSAFLYRKSFSILARSA
jgi:hypothetical protein